MFFFRDEVPEGRAGIDERFLQDTEYKETESFSVLRQLRVV
jgi:hypothetical protein